MFGIKRKGREHSSKLFEELQHRIVPMLQWIGSKARYNGRKRLFCRWGRKNPKKVIIYYASIASMLLVWNIMGMVLPRNSVKSNKSSDPLKLESVADGNNVFDGMTQINSNRESIKNAVQDYAEANLKIANRLDSLIRLDHKSRHDSIEIVRLYRKINPQ